MTTAPLPEKPKRRVVKKEPIPEQVEVPVEEPVVEEESELEQEETILDKIDLLKGTIGNIAKELKNLDSDIKKIFVEAKKQLKKKTKKTTKTSSNHGFNAEVLISDELADFLNVERGSKMRPPQVFSKVNEYAKEHDCKEPSNKSIFKCDKKLKKLLGEPIHLLRKDSPELGNGVSNFNINKYLSKHYKKIE